MSFKCCVQEFSVRYSAGKTVGLTVPGGWDLHRRNLARAFAATWQLSLNTGAYTEEEEVISKLFFL